MKEETRTLGPIKIPDRLFKRILEEKDIAEEIKRIAYSDFFRNILESFFYEIRDIYRDEEEMNCFIEKFKPADVIIINFMENILVKSFEENIYEISVPLKDIIITELKDDTNVAKMLEIISKKIQEYIKEILM